MVTFEQLNNSIDKLTCEDLERPAPLISLSVDPRNSWIKVIKNFNLLRLSESRWTYELNNSFHLLKNKFEQLKDENCTFDESDNRVGNYVSRFINHVGQDYSEVPSEVPTLQTVAYSRLNPHERKLYDSAVEAGVVPPANKARHRGGKKRKTKKRKKSKKLRKKNKRKTRKGGAATEPTPISSLAALASKNINNKKDLEYANSLQLGDKDAEANIQKKLKWIKQQEDARRATEQMRRQYRQYQQQNRGMSVAYRNQSVSRSRPKKAVVKNPE